jgi:hypothetical protein
MCASPLRGSAPTSAILAGWALARRLFYRCRGFVGACGFSSIMFFQEMILKMILKYPFSFQSPAEFDALSDEVNDPWAHGAPAPDDGLIAEDVLACCRSLSVGTVVFLPPFFPMRSASASGLR